MNRKRLSTIVLYCLMSQALLAEVNWPCFRGPLGGVVEDEVLPVSWSTTDNVKWKIDVVGRAWSSPVVWGDKIFLTTVASEGHVEEAKKGLYFGGNRNEPSSAIHHWIVYCYDWASGKTLWQKTVHTGKPAQPVHIKDVHDRGTVNCYEGKTGKLIYEKQQLAKDARAFTVSPWANDGKLFFLSEDGDTFVVKAGSEFKVLGRNPLDEMCMATPATLRGSIIIRTLNKLYRIGK